MEPRARSVLGLVVAAAASLASSTLVVGCRSRGSGASALAGDAAAQGPAKGEAAAAVNGGSNSQTNPSPNEDCDALYYGIGTEPNAARAYARSRAGAASRRPRPPRRSATT